MCAVRRIPASCTRPRGRVLHPMPAHETLSLWESFYVIVGSSAGALAGLQFVVMALVTESSATRSMGEIAAFGTPTIVHFCEVLLIAASLSAPWPTLGGPAT